MDDCAISASSFNIIDKFEEAFPVYLTFGMSAKEYWEGEPKLCRAYRKAYEMQIDKENQLAWLNGLYVYDAFGCIISTAFGKKGSRAESYPKEPFNIREKSSSQKKLDDMKKQEQIIKRLETLQNIWVSSHKGDNNGRDNNIP